MQVRRQMVKHKEQRVVNGLLIDQMVVIQQQDGGHILSVQVIQECGKADGERGRLRRSQHQEGSLSDSRQAGSQSTQDRDPEARRVVI